MTTSTVRRQRFAAPATRLPGSVAPAVSLRPTPEPGVLARLVGRARAALRPGTLRRPAAPVDLRMDDAVYRNDEGGAGDDGGWG